VGSSVYRQRVESRASVARPPGSGQMATSVCGASTDVATDPKMPTTPGQTRFRRFDPDPVIHANGKKPAVATTAIAREIAAFLWAIGHQVEPKTVTSN
jgi:hypothetical protein